MHFREPSFLYSEKLNLRINENKLKELQGQIEKNFEPELKKDKMNIEKIEKEFDEKMNSNDSDDEFFQEMNIKSHKIGENRIFFATH